MNLSIQQIKAALVELGVRTRRKITSLEHQPGYNDTAPCCNSSTRVNTHRLLLSFRSGTERGVKL